MHLWDWDLTNYLVGAIGAIVGVIGAIVAWRAFKSAEKADTTARDLLDSFLNDAQDFERLGEIVVKKFLCAPTGADCRISIALLSPVFGGIERKANDRSIWGSFITALDALKKEPVSIRILFLCDDAVAAWYEKMFELLARSSTQEDMAGILTRCVARAVETRDQFVRLLRGPGLKAEVVFRRTKEMPIQIFVRNDSEGTRAMFGLMGSHFPGMAVNMLDSVDYRDIETFSKGFYSSELQFAKEYETVFETIWSRSKHDVKQSASGKEAGMTIKEVEDYFDGVVTHVIAMHDRLLSPDQTQPASSASVTPPPSAALPPAAGNP